MTNQGRAFVLGGGGVTGVAWEIGLLHGLAEHGVDLTGADLLVGPSAGSVVAAQVGSAGRAQAARVVGQVRAVWNPPPPSRHLSGTAVVRHRCCPAPLSGTAVRHRCADDAADAIKAAARRG